MLRVQTCPDAMRSIFAYLTTSDLFNVYGADRFIMEITLQLLTQTRNNPILRWRIQSDAGSLVFQRFKNSKLVKLVSEFQINIPDLAGLMMLPDLLNVIHDRLLEDRQLQVYKPIVILQNQLSTNYLEDGFDQAKLENKFNYFFKKVEEVKLFKIQCNMGFLTEMSRCIFYNFLISLNGNLLDLSILQSDWVKREEENFEVIDLIFLRSHSLYLDPKTFNIIPGYRRCVYTNVKKLQIDEIDKFCGGLYQLAMQFPDLEILDVGLIFIDPYIFFSRFEFVFNQNMLRNLKCFKAELRNLENYSLIQIRKMLVYLFQKIVNIEVPKIKLLIKVDCINAGFINPSLDLSFYNIFNGCRVKSNYANFEVGQNIFSDQECKMIMKFNKDINKDIKYNIDITYKKKLNKNLLN
eukprot:403357485